MIKNVSNDYIVSGLNEYIKEVKKITSRNDECKDYSLLSSSYNIGKIIDDLLEIIVKKYKDKTIKKINSKYQQYTKKINNSLDLNEIKKTINNEIDSTYNSYLLPALKKFAIYESGTEYSNYDFNNEIKKGIDSIINQNIQTIENIISLTKGSNYNVDIYLYSWEKMSFSKVELIISPMCKSFNKFFEFKEIEQNNSKDSKNNNIYQNKKNSSIKNKCINKYNLKSESRANYSI